MKDSEQQENGNQENKIFEQGDQILATSFLERAEAEQDNQTRKRKSEKHPL